MASLRHAVPHPSLEMPRVVVAFAHESVTTADGVHGKTRYFQRIGEATVCYAITRMIYSRSDKTDDENEADFNMLISDENLAEWAKAYDFPSYSARSKDAPEHDNASLARLFKAFTGAVDTDFGGEQAARWIRNIWQYLQTTAVVPPGQPPTPLQLPATAYPHGAWGQSPASVVGQPVAYPGPSSLPANTYPAQSQFTSGSFQSQPTYGPPQIPRLSKPFVAVLNEGTQQKKRILQYTADSSGPAHQLTWTVHVYLDGQHFTTGHGNSKQTAKEDAARLACQQLGWG